MSVASNILSSVRASCIAALASLGLILPGVGHAAPQALGLIATHDAMPLQCSGGVCVAFLSSFCLEEERSPPASRTAYVPAPGTEIALLVETEDGRTVRLPGAEYLTFRVRLDFTSVLAKVALARLAAYSPKRLHIDVGSLATLLPKPVPEDPDVHSPEELKLVTGPYRKTGRLFFDAGDGTVSMMTQLINRLPRLARAPKSTRDDAYRSVATGAEGRASDAAARVRFRNIVESCEGILATTKRMNMRDCLTYRHEVMQTKTNRAFWKALGGV